MWRFAVDGKTRDSHGAIAIPILGGLAPYLCMADKFDRLRLAQDSQYPVADP
jgi:hypothetical protein